MASQFLNHVAFTLNPLKYFCSLNRLSYLKKDNSRNNGIPIALKMILYISLLGITCYSGFWIRRKVIFQNQKKYPFSEKFFSLPSLSTNESKNFMPLSIEKVEKLLQEFPELMKTMVAQGRIKAETSILNIYQEGIPRRLSKNSNEELMKQMQFIIYQINEKEKKEERRELLSELVECLKDCVPVTQGNIAKMYQKLSAYKTGFAIQVEAFIADYKDRIVDQVIYELFPEMQEPEYSKNNYHEPSKQFPHVKSGFLKIKADVFGLSKVGAENDLNANQEWVREHSTEFDQKFLEKISIDDFIKEFVTEINGAYKNFLIIEDFLTWIGKEFENKNPHQFYYDENKQYPTFSPKLQEEHKSLIWPFINESDARQILIKLKYIPN